MTKPKDNISKKSDSKVSKPEVAKKKKPAAKKSNTPEKKVDNKEHKGKKIKSGAAQTKKRRTIKPTRQSKHNPTILMLEQQAQHRVRVAKIVAFIFTLMVVGFACIYFYKKWEKKEQHLARIAAVSKTLDTYDKILLNQKGYERDQTILKAVAQVDKVRFMDPENNKKWVKKRKKYLKVLELSSPKLEASRGENFIEAEALLDMVHIPQGRFYMGKRKKERGTKDERPRHPVIISKEFWIARTEVTNRQFRIIFPHFDFVPEWDHKQLNSEQQPVIGVNWHYAARYCEILTEKAKKAGRLPKGYEYRLPTEAEWEYSCRAGTTDYFYWGNTFGKIGAKFANTLDLVSAKWQKCGKEADIAPDDNYRLTAPVGSFQPNAFGLYDMIGNAWEWCYDWYNPKAYKELPMVDPVQLKPVVSKMKTKLAHDAGYGAIETTGKVVRGGGCLNFPSTSHSAARDFVIAEKKDLGISFRVVLAPIIKKK